MRLRIADCGLRIGTVCVGLLAIVAGPAGAHEGCGAGEFGNHWECSLYLGEMRLQVAVMMAAVVVAAGAGWLIKRARRGERQ